MADNSLVRILTALLKHQVKKLVGEEALGAIGEELTAIGGDKLDEQVKEWLGEETTAKELEKAAIYAHECFRDKIGDHEVEQWMASLPLGNLPKVVEALEQLPTSPDEGKLENALRESIALNWKKLTPEQVDNAVNSFLYCLRRTLLPIEKQTLMVIGRSVLRTEDKVDLLLHWFEQYIITGKSVEIKRLDSAPVDYWNLKHPYPMPPNFTGRVDERKMLVDWLNKDNKNRLLIIHALGGFGKSALAWHWLTHDVDSKEWTKVLWWSFYEGDASFEHFVEETLKYLKLEVPQGQRPQVDELLKAMQGQKILFIMDGFERALRAYGSMNAAYQGDESPSRSTPMGLPAGEGQGEGGCVNINAEVFLKSVCSLPDMKSKVLMTTRLTPRAVKPRGEFLQGCREEELTAMQKADAVEFFHKQKIKGTHAEIEAACAPYGYHPLSLRLLAGRILKDFDNPADIVVAQKLKIDGDLKQHQHHVLEVSYSSLPPHEQKLLNTIACFRSLVELKTLEAIAENLGADGRPPLRDDLHDLVERGLLNFIEKNKKFDLHPIVRRYAYERLTAPDRAAAHSHLSDYFAKLDMPEIPQTLDDLAPAIERYHHTVRAGKLDEALQFMRQHLVPFPLHFQFGAYQLMIELKQSLFLDGENKPPHVSSKRAQSWVLNALAGSYSLLGQPRKAVSLFMISAELNMSIGDEKNLIVDLVNMASTAQIPIGMLAKAEQNLRRILDMCQQSQDEFQIAVGRHELGCLLSYRGMWEESQRELNMAKEAFDEFGVQRTNFVMIVRTYLAQLQLFRKNFNAALNFAKEALVLSEYQERSTFGGERDLVRAHWLLGAAYRLNNQPNLAEHHLNEALTRDRSINLVEMEANILLDLARLRYDQKNYEEAKPLVKEALTITERCGYVLQGADVNLFLAQFALEQEKDKAKAKQYAETALKLATCDGPPYYYKVAYEEAARMLEKLGKS